MIAVGDSLRTDGTLRVHRLGGYVPAVGDRFPVFTFAAATGDFDRIEYDGFDADVAFSTTLNRRNFALEVAAVPEPHEYALMRAGLGAGAMLVRRRRRAG